MIKKIVLCSIIISCSISLAMTFSEYETFGKITKPANQFPASVGRFNNLLMILESTGDSIGLYDPQDGTYIRSLCYVSSANTPINAVQGPDNKIYVSDQVSDKVTMYDTTGAFLGVYADNTDGLDNVRGIAFRGDHLFISVSPSAGKAVKEFRAPHTFVRDFVNYAGVDPFDIYFLPNGKALVADLGTTDQVSLCDTNGAFIRQVISANFPEQIQIDPILPGNLLVAGFSSNTIRDFDTTGVVYKTWPLGGARGVYRLGNGNILGTYGSGIVEIDSGTGTILQNEHGGSGRFIEFYHATGANVSESENIRTVTLGQIYPNPFANTATIKYNLTHPDKVTVKIYNCLGNEVRTLIDQHQTAGSYSLNWNGKDNLGQNVSNGIYMCQINTINHTEQKQLILIK